MLILSLSTLTILILAVNIPTVTPLTLPSAAQAQLCTNAPHTVAGTLFDRGTTLPDRRTPLSAPVVSTPLVPRKRNEKILWCAPGTETYVTILLTITAPTRLAAGLAIKEALNMAAMQISAVISLQGDGIIPSGHYEYDFAGGAQFRTWNANNHQQTYGVVGAAISALKDYMLRHQYCAADFEIWDGGIQVGVGQIENA